MMLGIFRTPERLILPSTPEEGAALARRYRKRLWLMMFVGNLVGGIPSILGTFASAPLDPDPAHAARHLALNLASTAAWLVVFGFGIVPNIRLLFRPTERWLIGSRAPNEADAKGVVSLPRRMAHWSIYWWLAIPIWSTPYGVLVVWRGFHLPPWYLIQGTITLLLGAVTGVILVYLLAERALRPLTGLATRGSSRAPSRVSALTRLIMAFVAGVAVPLAALGIGLVGLNERQRAAAEPSIWLTIVAVVIAGLILAIVTARSLTDPLSDVLGDFGRVKEGDLDVELEVNEPGQIGELQAGFNEMVAALRERERMREVFVRLVGKDVAEHALAQGSALDGEMREATAMFVDVVGSTSLSQRNTEYDYWMQLNAFFDIVVRCVETAGGFVNKFEGDGALCVFGAPVVAEDHAARALGAARALRAELDTFAAASGIETVVGLSTGNVVAGYVGTADRYEFTVIGDAVNEAKRLTDEAKTTDAKILVSEATIRAAEGEVANWREAGSTQLRGRSGPTLAFQPRPVEASADGSSEDVESAIRLEERPVP